MNKKIISLISFAIIILSGSIIFFLSENPEIRYYIGTQTGLKDKPFLYDSNFLIEEVIVGIQSSTGLTVIDNDIIFLEKETGKIRLITDGKLIEQPLWDFQVRKEGCECYTESGLLGITSLDNQIYIYVTEEHSENSVHNKIYKFDWINKKLENQILLNQLPSVSNEHHGGAIETNLDGDVFAVIGDQNLETELQNIDNGIIDDVGIILKVGLDKNIISPSSSSNPDDHYYGVGIRNSFGLSVDPFTNSLWITENGTHEFDEINLTFPKYNSGWSKILGPATPTQLKNFEGYHDYIYSDPEFSWEQTVAPTGISFVDERWSKYSDKVFVGDCAGNLYKFQLNQNRDGFIFKNKELQDLVLNAGDSNQEILFGENFGCITEIEFSSDGSLYVISYLNNGAIYKIQPK